MKKAILFLTVFVMSVAFTKNIANAEFSLEQWPYYKDIINGTVNENEKVEIKIDDELLSQAQDKFRDLRIIDSTGTEVSYQLSEGVAENVAIAANVIDVTVDDVSIPTDDLNIYALNDDNKRSYLDVSGSIPGNIVSIVFDLGEIVPLEKIVLYSYDKAKSFDEIEVLGSKDNAEYKVIRSKYSDSHQTWRWYTFPKGSNFQFVKVNLSKRGDLRINEIMLLSENNGTINFESNIGETYKMYYGNLKASIPEYGNHAISETLPVFRSTLSKQIKNPEFDKDIDKDSFAYTDDNCPAISNVDQLDSNNDGVGDACSKELPDEVKKIVEKKEKVSEEAISTDEEINKVKSDKTEVNDRDGDSVTNFFDNCPDKYNTKQEDSNKNGIGDACESNGKFVEYSKILAVALLFVVTVILVSIIKLSFSLEKKKKRR